MNVFSAQVNKLRLICFCAPASAEQLGSGRCPRGASIAQAAAARSGAARLATGAAAAGSAGFRFLVMLGETALRS